MACAIKQNTTITGTVFNLRTFLEASFVVEKFMREDFVTMSLYALFIRCRFLTDFKRRKGFVVTKLKITILLIFLKPRFGKRINYVF